MTSAPIIEVTVFGLSAGAVFGLLAIGLVLIYRTTGVLNFAHWAMGLVAIVGYALLSKTGIPAPVAALLSVGVSVAAGVGAYRLVFRRLGRSNQIIVILVSIGMAGLLSAVASMVLGFESFTQIPPWLPVREMTLGGVRVSSTEVFTAVVAVGVAFGFLAWFRLSMTGRALRAVAQNREAAALAGIDEVRHSSIAWGVGSAMAALALLMVLPHVAGTEGGLITTFDLTPFGTLLIPAFGAALVGGMVNLPMALLGGFVFGLSRELLVLAPKPWSDLRSTIAAILIVALLLLRTERFFATRQELEALEL
jgi:branched-chain amino acid transport system permease protein